MTDYQSDHCLFRAICCQLDVIPGRACLLRAFRTDSPAPSGDNRAIRLCSTATSFLFELCQQTLFRAKLLLLAACLAPSKFISVTARTQPRQRQPRNQYRQTQRQGIRDRDRKQRPEQPVLPFLGVFKHPFSTSSPVFTVSDN